MEFAEDVLPDVLELWGNFFSFIQCLVNGLTPVEDRTQFFIRWHCHLTVNTTANLCGQPAQ